MHHLLQNLVFVTPAVPKFEKHFDFTLGAGSGFAYVVLAWAQYIKAFCLLSSTFACA
jgi:hypothetical protein